MPHIKQSKINCPCCHAEIVLQESDYSGQQIIISLKKVEDSRLKNKKYVNDEEWDE